MEEEYPDIASYLTSLASPQTINTSTPLLHTPPHLASTLQTISTSQTSEYHAAREAEGLTDSLLSSVNEIMVRTEAEGTDPDLELRALVEQTVMRSMVIGNGWADQQRESMIEETKVGTDGAANKKRRIDEDEGGPNGAT